MLAIEFASVILLLFNLNTQCQATLLEALQNFPLWLTELLFGNPTSNTVPPDVLEEIYMDPIQQIEKNGFPVELHVVHTIDGYHLNLYHIPNNNASSIPILMMHGTASSCQEYTSDLENSPALLLYQNGFDVWLGNFRFSGYAAHSTLTRQDKEYWNFNVDDLAAKDLPAQLDYVVWKTKPKKVVFLAHSLGTAVGFSFFSSHPEYQDKVSSIIAISPVASSRYSSALFLILSPFFEILLSILEAVGQYSFMVTDEAGLKKNIESCASDYQLCELQSMAICGWNPYYHNQTRLPLYSSTGRYGMSTKAYKHLAQINKYNGLRHFDYGPVKNKQKYNQSTPPIYDVGNIAIPVLLAAGPNDGPVGPLDIAYSKKYFRNATWYVIPRPMTSHIDSIYSFNNFNTLYGYVVEYVKKYY